MLLYIHSSKLIISQEDRVYDVSHMPLTQHNICINRLPQYLLTRIGGCDGFVVDGSMSLFENFIYTCMQY